MKLDNDVLTNFNNVFILIRIDTQFKFNNNAEMRGFIKYKFEEPSANPDSAYCLQESD